MPYDPNHVESLIKSIKPLEPINPNTDPGFGFSKQGAFEFLGQALWGGVSGATWGVPEIYDTIKEGVTGEADELEKTITSIPARLLSTKRDDFTKENYAGDFSPSGSTKELTTIGKSGYTLGNVLGMIGSFSWLGKGINWAAKSLGKTSAIKAAQSDITQTVGQMVFKSGQQVGAQEFTEESAQKIATSAIEAISKAGPIYQATKELTDGAFNVFAKQSIAEEAIRPILGRNVDKNLIDDIADEVFKIAQTRNPDEAMNIINNNMLNVIQKTTNLSPKAARLTSSLAGATAYDALLGLVMGTTTGLAQYGIGKYYPDPDSEEHTLQDLLLGSVKESAIMAVLGPTKFIKGGGTAGSYSKITDTTRGIINQLKPVKNMTPKQLEKQIELYHKISGENLTAVLGTKWAHKGDNWWRGVSNLTGKESKKDISEMREIITDARRQFLKDAPGYLAREVGSDLFYSLPRMATGAVAMNLMGIHQSIKQYGVGSKGLLEGFGETDYEKFSNILTAMYFTKTPHSFNLVGAPRSMSGFSTGDIPRYSSIKAKQFRDTVTGLNLIGAGDLTAAQKIASQYGGFSTNTPKNHLDKIYSKSFEGSLEIQKIKEIIDPYTAEKYITPDNQEAKGDIFFAGSKYIDENVKSPGEKAEWRDKLSTAMEVIKFHDDHSIRSKGLSASLTKEGAATLIDALSSTKFDGVTLNKKQPREQMENWLATRVEREGNVPINILKNFIIDSYNDLGIANVIEKDGVILAPRIGANLYGSYMKSNPRDTDAPESVRTLVTVANKLEKVGILKYSDKIHESTSNDAIKNAINRKKEATSKLMQYVYGDTWDTKTPDNGILRNDSWYVVHTKLSENARMLNAERILKGAGQTSLDETNANRLYERLKDEISGNKFPEVVNNENKALDEVEISSNADLTSAIKDMKRVHKLISLVRPENNASSQKTIKPEELIELQNQWTRSLGDLVKNDEAYFSMQDRLIKQSIKDLGINGMDGGYNIHAAVHTLFTNREFMRDNGMQLPKVEQIANMLRAQFPKRNENTGEGREQKRLYEDIKDFYEKTVGAIQDSNLGMIQIRQMTEQQKGGWYEGIREAMIVGKGRASQFAVERIMESVKLGTKVLDEGHNLGKELAVAASVREANVGQAQDQHKLYTKNQEDLQRSVDLMKRALESGDGLVVHAFQGKTDRINELFELISKNMRPEGLYEEYIQEISTQIKAAQSEAFKNGWTELNVVQEAHKIMSRYSIPAKDQTDTSLRISSSQFAQRYNLNIKDMTDLFLSYKSMDRTMQQAGEVIERQLNNLELDLTYKIGDTEYKIFTPEDIAQIDKSKKHIAQVKKSGRPNPDSFWKDIVNPLMTSIKFKEQIRNIKTDGKAPVGGWDNFNQNLLSDISSITTAYFSSMPVKQYTYRDGELFVSNKQVGYTDKYGLQGVIQALNGTTEISLLSNTFHINGKYTPKPNKEQMKEIISNLEKLDGINVEMEGGFREFLGDREKVKDHSIAQGNETRDLNKQRFKVIAADENTLMIVRLGDDGRIQKDLKTAFRESSEDSNGNRIAGGHLYEKLQAVLEYDPIRKGLTDPPSKIKELVRKINRDELVSDNDVHDAIVLTRFLNDRPSMIGKLETMSNQERKKNWKYLKLSEMKNGFVGHEENLARVRSFLEGAADLDNTGFFKNVLNQVRTFLPKDKTQKFPKLKILSIADEMVHEGGKINIFSSLDHKTLELDKLYDNGNGVIDQKTYDENIASIKKVTKSIVDGETYLSKEAFVANLAMMGGISPDMIKFDKQGNIQEINIGGIKPTISHTDVKTDLKDMNSYGRVKEFYAKTAFKYNPVFDDLFKNNKIHGITFNSSNKINEFRNNYKDSWYNTDLEKMESTIAAGGRNVHASVKGIQDVKDLPTDFDSIGKWLSDNLSDNLIMHDTNISQIPFESINLKSLGQPHDPLVGSNISVHMHDNVGISEWIGLKSKIDNVYGAFENYVDPYYATKLAKDLFAHSSDTGDMAWLNTGIDHFLKNDGLLHAPWAKTKIEEKIIPYFMNNGMIAGGRVPDGSLDVMTADLGGLKTSIMRTENDGSKSVQFYGEFLQSKNSANKIFNGDPNKENIQSVIIQREQHAFVNEADVFQKRTSDVFMIKRGNQKYLVVEGKGIDKEGLLRNIYNDTLINYEGGGMELVKAQAYNKQLFERMEKKENDFLSQVNLGKDNYSQVMTKLYKYDNTMSIGSLNNRQPRNQAGDMVIARLKAFKKGGKIVTHNGDLSGNSSRMNHADAINPQDADYDMDKSSTFLAAPNRLWAESARLSGHRTVDDVKGLNQIYDTIFSKEYVKLFKYEEGDPLDYRQEIMDTDLARGRFVKMHQTLSYLQNIFKNDATMINFKDPSSLKQFTLKMSTDKLRYLNTVDEVSANVKLFLDMYKENPSYYTKNPNELLQNLYFGYKRNDQIVYKGLFDIYDNAGNKVTDINILDQTELMSKVRNDVFYGLLAPINKYLTYNKGTVVDETNRDMSATLQDYQNARRNLLYSINPKLGIGANIRLDKGSNDVVLYENNAMYTSANNYFDKGGSQNPYDIAMKGLHSVANKHHGLDEALTSTHEILNYVREGRMPIGWKLDKNISNELREDMKLNYISRIAMSQLAQKSGDIVRLEEFANNINRINSKLEYLDSIGGKSGDIRETREYQRLLSEKINTENLKSIIEESLSYDPTNPENDYSYNPATKKKKTLKKWKHKNIEKFPVVVVNSKGETKEVILPNKRNTRSIHPNDKLVINGSRYEIVDGETQISLKSDFKAFGGKTIYRKRDGTLIEVGEQAFINSQFKLLEKRINNLYKDIPVKNQAAIGEYSAKKTAEVLKMLSSPDFANNPERQFALLFRMLRPNWDSRVVPIIPTRFGNSSKTAIIGSQKFIENKFAKTVWNTLSQISSGAIPSPKGSMDKIRADRILKDLISLSRSHYAQEKWNVPINMGLGKKLGYTEPTELPNGFMTTPQYLNKDIFKIMRDGDRIQKHAAGIMYDYMSGKKLVDSATLYRASKEMEKANIPIDQQYIMKVYDRKSDTFGDVEVRDFGVLDAYNGNNKGQGGIVKESTKARVQEMFNCLNIKP